MKAPAIECPVTMNEQACIDYCEAIVLGEQWTKYLDEHDRPITREQWLEDNRRALLGFIEPGRRLTPATLYTRRRKAKRTASS